MKRGRRTSVALLALAAISSSSMRPVSACSPEFPVAVIVNRSHPDLSLRLIAAGQLGIIQPTWAKSYLCVAYRYLTSNKLNRAQQDQIVALWDARLLSASTFTSGNSVDQVEMYLRERSKALGLDDKAWPQLYSSVSSYSYQENIGSDAFFVAHRTLDRLTKKYGRKSQPVSEWLKAQDMVFGIGGTKKQQIPQALPSQADPILQMDRNYQIAAALFYSGDYQKASEAFQHIAQDLKSPWHALARYLVARAKAKLAAQGPTAGTDDYEQNLNYLKALLKNATDQKFRMDVDNLLTPILYSQMTRPQLIAHLVESVTAPDSQRFGRDVGDLTFTMDSGSDGGSESSDTSSPEAAALKRQQADDALLGKYDLADWLRTIQTGAPSFFYTDEEQAQAVKQWKVNAEHALTKWRQNHQLHWLIAAVATNDLRSPALADLLAAAKAIQSDSPAYLTANFFIVDSLVAAKRVPEARTRLDSALVRKNLPPSTRNLFQTQFLPVSQSFSQYLKNAIVRPPVVNSSLYDLPSNWQAIEQTSLYHTDEPVISDEVADQFNANLPLTKWAQMANDSKIDARLRGRIIRSTWLRALLLGKEDIARQLCAPFSRAYPAIAGLIAAYENAPAGAERKFAAASLVLKTYGMTPYLQSGVERHGGKLTEFDYYNANYWVALPIVMKKPSPDDEYRDSYPSVEAPGIGLIAKLSGGYNFGIDRLLTPAEKAQAAREKRIIWDNNPSKFVGDPVLARVKSNPEDPRLPELLYKLNRMPKWRLIDEVGSHYSHEAYNILHTRYSSSPWAKKAVCWY